LAQEELTLLRVKGLIARVSRFRCWI